MSAARAIARGPSPLMQAVKQFYRSIEPPTSPRPSFGSQRGDWGRIARARASQAAIYFPGLALILGWPILAREMLDGRM
ncbi:hypothetical protein F4778DRAFT_724334 [Xylariomycetidae sp. FL2044]|nr:hypothetical protein F4778DRAFT_724334 [Xylariomycetidae sp. FL2044]